MKTLLLVLAALLTIPASLLAVPTFVGSLATPSGVTSSLGWDAGNGGFTIAWTITQVSAQDWFYQYKLSNASGGELVKAPSHLIVEISANAVENDFWSFNGGWELNTYSGANQSNPNMPGALYSIKMNGVKNATSNLYEYFFHSKKAPTWGDFYAKDGKWAPTHTDVTAWNADFLQADPTAPAQDGLLQDASGRYINKILRPDTRSDVTPEPGTILLIGLGLGFLGLVLRTKA